MQLGVISVALSITNPAIAFGAEVVLDFEYLPAVGFFGGTAVPRDRGLDEAFASLGVSFSSEGGYAAVVQLGEGHAYSGVNGIGGVNSHGQLDYRAPVEIRFHEPNWPGIAATVEAVSLRLDRVGGGEPIRMRVEDVNGVLLREEIFQDIGGGELSFAAAGIHKVVIWGNGGSAFDNLKFRRTSGMEVIHFEDLGNMGFFGGTAVPTEARLKEQLAEKGVLFDSPGGAVAVVNLGVGHARSGTLGIGGITAGGALSYGLEAPVTVRFMRVNSAQELVIATTEQVEVWIDRLTGAPGEVTLQAFGLANELLGSVSTADSPEHPYLRIEQKGIHQITITGNGHTALDDLWYAPPEQVEIRLEAKVRNRGLELSWPRVGGYMLESTRTLNPPILWQEISSEEGFARVALDEPERYFRLRRMNQQVEKLR